MPTVNLERAIFQTVAWFSLFSYPLTAFEIWKWLIAPASSFRLEDVLEALENNSWLRERLQFQDGFYALTGETRNVATRQERFLDAVRKFRRLRRATRYLSRLPAVRAVAACNTLAWSNTTSQSDIDLFLIVRSGCLWTTRFFAVLPFMLLGYRPGQTVRDPFCFSFFITEDRMNLSDTRRSEGDLYLAFWILSLYPVSEQQNIMERFLSANDWVAGLLPNGFGVSPVRERYRAAERPFFPNWSCPFDSLLRIWQWRRLPSELRRLNGLDDSRVILNESRIKCHPNDRREEFERRWQTLCSSV